MVESQFFSVTATKNSKLLKKCLNSKDNLEVKGLFDLILLNCGNKLKRLEIEIVRDLASLGR